jgi:hypothetical protein
VAEKIYGPSRFLLAYVASGVAGSLASFLFLPNLSVGASGAIFGVAGLLIVFGLRHRSVIPKRARRVFEIGLLPWVALILALGFLLPGLDNAAHLGGCLAGMLLGLVLRPVAIVEEEGSPLAKIALRGAVVASALVLLAGLFFVARPLWKGPSFPLLERVDREAGLRLSLSPAWREKVVDGQPLWVGLHVPLFTYWTGLLGEGEEEEAVREFLSDLSPQEVTRPERHARGLLIRAETEMTVPTLSGPSLERVLLLAYVVRPVPPDERAAILLFVVKPDDLEATRFVLEDIMASVRFL